MFASNNNLEVLKYIAAKNNNRLSLSKYANIKDPVGKVVTAWMDTRPDKRLSILQSKQSTFFNEEFVIELYYLQDIKGIDVTQLTVQQLDKIYEDVHKNHLDNSAAGASIMGSIASGLSKVVNGITSGFKGTGKNIIKTFDDIVDEATFVRKTKGGTKMYDKSGGYNKALEDFNSLGVKNVQNKNGRIIGELSDGTYVNIHKSHLDELNRWTLEYKKVKIRYND